MLIVEENYAAGVPQTIISGFKALGIAWHWTAGGTGRIGWNGTVAHLIATRASINASYHAGFWVEHTTSHIGCKTFVQWIVPSTRAAHSIAPSQVFQLNATKDAALQGARFAEVRRILGTKANDPNAACIALSYAGMPANLESDLSCSVFRADVQNLARQMEARPDTVEDPHFGHGWIQPITRYEMDVAVDFIGMLYGKEAEDMKLLPSAQTLMQGRLRETTGIARLPVFDAELIATVQGGTILPIVHWMPGQGPYTIDGVPGRDWQAVVVNGEVGYVEAPYLVDVRLSTIGAKLVPTTGFTQAQVDALVTAAVSKASALAVEPYARRLTEVRDLAAKSVTE